MLATKKWRMKFQIPTYNSIKKNPKILVIDKQKT